MDIKKKQVYSYLQSLVRTQILSGATEDNIVTQLVEIGTNQVVAKQIVASVMNETSSATETVDLPQQLKSAIAQYSQGDIKQASALFETVLSVDQNNPDALLYMGRIYDQLGELGQAIEFMRKAALVRPQYLELYSFGNILLKRGFVKRAMLQFHKAVVSEPHRTEARLKMASVWVKLGLSKAPLDILQRIIARNPNCEEARTLLARLISSTPELKLCGMPVKSPKLSRDVSEEFNLPPQVCLDLADYANPGGLYGITQVVANKLGMHPHPPNFSFWPQGWDTNVGEGVFFPLQAHMREVVEGRSLWLIPRDTMLLLATEKAANWARLYGFKSKAVGSSFCYSDHDKTTKRIPGSLLVMPTHGGKEDEAVRIRYLEYIKSITHHFSRVVFCFNKDSISGEGGWHKDVDNYGFDFVVGASSHDQNSIPRMRKIFDSFEYMTTNSRGTHLLAASFFGVKVSIAGPFYDWFIPSRNMIRMGVAQGGALSGLDSTEVYYEKSYLMRNYPWFFVEPQNATNNEEWAKKESGSCNKVSFEELGRLFGWY